MGFFSKLFSALFGSKSASSSPAKPAATAPAAAPAAKPAAAASPAAKPAAASAAPAAKPAAAAPAAAPADVLRPFSGDMISVPVATIIEGLPADLKALVATAPDAAAKFDVPVQLVLEGLPKGAVKVSFAELKRGSPAGTFQSAPEHDEKKVSLPLKAILPQIKPDQMKTKGTKTVDVPDSIAAVFTRPGDPK